jgi:hypothetical protein
MLSFCFLGVVCAFQGSLGVTCGVLLFLILVALLEKKHAASSIAVLGSGSFFCSQTFYEGTGGCVH